MSRIRIVKGKIYEKIGGDLKYYSEADITEIASETYAEQSAKEISHGADPEKPSLGVVKAKCIVKFRPNDNYDGEYGIDYLREGDIKMKGDRWFGKIMGKYYKADGTTVFDDTNSWSPIFKKDAAMYQRKLRSYKSLIISWKKQNGKPYVYPIPVLTLLKGKSAILSLKVEIVEVPKELTFEFKDKNAANHLSISVNKITKIKKGKYDVNNYLKITSLKEFSTDEILYVKADGEICGAIRIHPNTAAFQLPKNIAIIKVETNVNGNSNRKVGAPKPNSLAFFKKCCNQAFVIPHIVEEPIPLDCRGPYFQSRFCTMGILDSTMSPGFRITNDDRLRDYLEGMFTRKFGNKYNGYIKLFFIGEEADWNGFSYSDSTFAVYFGGHNRGTIAHETFHAMKLPHTFASINQGTLIAKYTYQAGQTNNIMDYSHQVQFGSIDRKMTYLWQWNILNNRVR
jgi:hypothetical protein